MLNRITGFGLVLVLAIGLAVAHPVQAQDGPPIGVWQKEVKVGLNILQSSYSNNWNGGEKGSVVWNGNLDARYEKQFSATSNWRNTLKLAYGQSHNQARGTDGQLFWKKPDKTDDIIDLESMFRWTMSSGWDPFVSFNFTSLFEDLTDAGGRAQNFNPMSFKESAGMSRNLIDADGRKLMTRIGVAFVQNRRGFFLDPVPSTETTTETSTEVAAEWITEYKVGALDGRVDWESKLAVTKPFAYSGKSVFEDGFTSVAVLPEDVADYTTTVDLDWENTFTANITKVISVKLFVRWVYDKYDNTVKPVVDDGGNLANEADVLGAIRKAGQFKQTLALGLGYTFN